MTGSEKQIKWASDIRENFVAKHPSLRSAASLIGSAKTWIDYRTHDTALVGKCLSELRAASREDEYAVALAGEIRATVALRTRQTRATAPLGVYDFQDAIAWIDGGKSVFSDEIYAALASHRETILSAVFAPIAGREWTDAARVGIIDLIDSRARRAQDEEGSGK
jgi:hypothetical protein